MNTFKKIVLSLALVAFLSLSVAPPATAQVIMTSTTLAGNLSSTSTLMAVTSATGIVTPGFNTPNQPTGNKTILVVDGEAMDVVGINGTVITVIRGTNHSRASAHNNLATVWVAPPTYISANIPQGACDSTNLLVLPRVVFPTVNPGDNGATFDCLGVAPNGQWVQTNAPGPTVFGSTVASVAGVITPTGSAFKVSGVAAITGITLPNGWAAGMSIYVVPTGIFTWTTATNISLAGTSVVGKTIIFTWDGAKWNPSVVA